jgi:hypothetical protein
MARPGRPQRLTTGRLKLGASPVAPLVCNFVQTLTAPGLLLLPWLFPGAPSFRDHALWLQSAVDSAKRSTRRRNRE